MSLQDLRRFDVPFDDIKKQREYAAMAKSVLDARMGEGEKFAYVHTFGCQGNVSDSERLKGWLSLIGYSFTEDIERADLVL